VIEALSDRFSVAWLCKQLGVARSGFYAWRQRQQNPGLRALESAAITVQVQTVFERHRGFYGAPRVHQELRAAGLKVGRHRIARIMPCSALKAKSRRGLRPCHNSGSTAAGVVENLLQQEFSPAAPNRCWAGDITYIRTTAGWRYLAVWIDLYSRRVVGWALGGHHGGHIGAGGPQPGPGAPPDGTRPAPDPHRSGEPVPGNGLPAAAGKPQDQLQHVGQGLLLGQRCGGELLLHPQTRTGPR